jgi:RNA polymerase sigma-70 factor (ECF subfamily)
MNDASADADVAAMLRLRDGDDLALNELMNRWQQPLVRFLYRYTLSEADSLDLAQDTFVRVYEHRAKYDARGKFSTWIYTIATNLCRNHARWKSRHPTVSMETELSANSDATLGEQLPDAKATPAQSAQTDELAGAVRDAIQELPDDQRTATILFEYEDQSHAEIAAVLGCSAKAVETRLYRARQFLRERLGRWLK